MTYRIDGFRQIKALYSIVFSQKYEFTPHHISLYVFLINQNNRNEWVEWFKCPYDLAMAGACIGNKKTYYKCLNDLQEWGLLEYQKGVNEWKAPRIKLEVLKCTSSVPQSVPLHTPLDTTLPTPLDTTLVGINKDNLKPKTLNLKQSIDFSVFWDLYQKKVDKKTCKIKWDKLPFATRQKIIDYLPAYIKSTPDIKFRKDPKTFLNNESWENQIIESETDKPISERYREHLIKNKQHKNYRKYVYFLDKKKETLIKYKDIITIDEFSNFNINGNIEMIVLGFTEAHHGKTKDEFIQNFTKHVRKY